MVNWPMCTKEYGEWGLELDRDPETKSFPCPVQMCYEIWYRKFHRIWTLHNHLSVQFIINKNR